MRVVRGPINEKITTLRTRIFRYNGRVFFLERRSFLFFVLFVRAYIVRVNTVTGHLTARGLRAFTYTERCIDVIVSVCIRRRDRIVRTDFLCAWGRGIAASMVVSIIVYYYLSRSILPRSGVSKISLCGAGHEGTGTIFYFRS